MHQPPLVEFRTFAIFVENRESGKYTQKITSAGDLTTVECSSSLRIKVLTYNYSHTYNGVEKWSDGKLQSIIANSNDNGTLGALKVTRQDDKLLTNGKAAPDDSWSTSYWTLPDLKEKQTNLIDADNGQIYKVKLALVGQDKLSVGNKQVNTKHYKVSGGIEVDLWFDESNKLVRREMLRKNRRAVLMLIGTSFGLPS